MDTVSLVGCQFRNAQFGFGNGKLGAQGSDSIFQKIRQKAVIPFLKKSMVDMVDKRNKKVYLNIE